MAGYVFNYEYVDRKGKFNQVHCCTVYPTYEAADEALADDISRMIEEGCTEVQGSVKEA